MTGADPTGPKLLARRLSRGIGANAVGPVLTTAIQLISVPLLIHAWGVPKYGDWLLLSAVPSYLIFSGLGFGDSSASQMGMRVAANDKPGALQTFESSWWLVAGMSLAVMIAVLAGVWWIHWQALLHLTSVPSLEAAQILLVLSLWVLVAQLSGVIESGYRCDGNYALGTLGGTFQRLLEVVVGTTVGVVTRSLLSVSVSYLLCRVAATLVYWLVLKRLSPWLELGFKHARLATIREMLKPSFGFIALPVGNAVSFQGFTLLVGIVLGPVAVTVFSTARTLTRVGSQVVNTISFGIWPELSFAFGAGNLSLARSLHRHAFQASLILSLGCSAFLWLFGPAIYHVWLRKSVPLDLPSFHILLLVAIANSLWSTSAVVQMSANKHSRIAFLFLGTTVASCFLGFFLCRAFGLAGAAAAVLLIDLVMCALVLRTSLRQMQDTPRAFFRAVFSSMPYFLRPLLEGRAFRR